MEVAHQALVQAAPQLALEPSVTVQVPAKRLCKSGAVAGGVRVYAFSISSLPVLCLFVKRCWGSRKALVFLKIFESKSRIKSKVCLKSVTPPPLHPVQGGSDERWDTQQANTYLQDIMSHGLQRERCMSSMLCLFAGWGGYDLNALRLGSQWVQKWDKNIRTKEHQTRAIGSQCTRFTVDELQRVQGQSRCLAVQTGRVEQSHLEGLVHLANRSVHNLPCSPSLTNQRRATATTSYIITLIGRKLF